MLSHSWLLHRMSIWTISAIKHNKSGLHCVRHGITTISRCVCMCVCVCCSRHIQRFIYIEQTSRNCKQHGPFIRTLVQMRECIYIYDIALRYTRYRLGVLLFNSIPEHTYTYTRCAYDSHTTHSHNCSSLFCWRWRCCVCVCVPLLETQHFIKSRFVKVTRTGFSVLRNTTR